MESLAVSNRVVDYCGFAVRFIGLGYLVLWPLASSDPFGLARFCRPQARYWQLFCHWPQLVHLTPGLHLIGLFCTGVLAIHLALRLAARFKRARARRANAALALTARVPAALARAPQRAGLVAPLPKVKPRSQFGLRPSPRGPPNSGVVSPRSNRKTPAEHNQRS